MPESPPFLQYFQTAKKKCFANSPPITSILPPTLATREHHQRCPGRHCSAQAPPFMPTCPALLRPCHCRAPHLPPLRPFRCRVAFILHPFFPPVPLPPQPLLCSRFLLAPQPPSCLEDMPLILHGMDSFFSAPLLVLLNGLRDCWFVAALCVGRSSTVLPAPCSPPYSLPPCCLPIDTIQLSAPDPCPSSMYVYPAGYHFRRVYPLS